MSERDTLTPEATRAKDRELGTAVRTFSVVVGMIAVVLVAGFHLYSGAKDIAEDEAGDVGRDIQSKAEIQNEKVASEMRSIREQSARDQQWLREFLQRLDGRMDALEKRR